MWKKTQKDLGTTRPYQYRVRIVTLDGKEHLGECTADVDTANAILRDTVTRMMTDKTQVIELSGKYIFVDKIIKIDVAPSPVYTDGHSVPMFPR
jgi:hypothetical protein